MIKISLQGPGHLKLGVSLWCLSRINSEEPTTFHTSLYLLSTISIIDTQFQRKNKELKRNNMVACADAWLFNLEWGTHDLRIKVESTTRKAKDSAINDAIKNPNTTWPSGVQRIILKIQKLIIILVLSEALCLLSLWPKKFMIAYTLICFKCWKIWPLRKG